MTAREFRRTAFGSRLLRHAMRDRARRETGSPESSVSPMFDDWREGVHERIRRQTADLVAARGIRLHNHIRAVNSSMAFAFNLFMPFREYGAAALEGLLARTLPFTVRVVGIEFEFHGPTDILAECAGSYPAEEERYTASDVAVRVEDANGRAGLVLIEVKLSEGEFTPCNGARSPANTRKDVCASAAKLFADPRTCYLTRPRHARRDRRYWEIFERAFGSVGAVVPGYGGGDCPFRFDRQQIMRNHALALGLVQSGTTEFTAFVLVHHPDNHHVVEPWEEYRSVIADASRFFRIPANALVDSAAGRGGWWRAWGTYMQERYMLPTIATSL